MPREFIINKPALKPRRKQLRSQPTPAEKLLWGKLRKKQLGFWFKRQVSISNYVIDFYCPPKRLAIELDGSIHKTPSQKKYDLCRTRYLQSFNITEIRFWNSEVERNIHNILQKIYSTLYSSPNLGEETKKEE